jgi:hypothetical protein
MCHPSPASNASSKSRLGRAQWGAFLSLGFPLRLEEREDLRERGHRAVVGIDVVQTGGLRLRAGGSHTFDGHHHLIPQKKASCTVERTQMLVTTPATSTVATWRSRKWRSRSVPKNAL